MTKPLTKLTLSVAASAVLVSSAFALDPAVTNFGYVYGGSNNLTIFNASDPTKIKTITGVVGESVGISPTGAWLYGTNNAGTITKYNVYTGASGASVAVGTSPISMTLSSDGTTAYVVNRDSDTISIINTATNTVTATTNVGNFPSSVVLSPDGSKVYVTNGSDNTISIINTTTNLVLTTINTGTFPSGIAISQDGSKVYVNNYFGDNVSIINTATNAIIATINVGINPTGITLSPDGLKAYVTNGNSDTISVIDTTTNIVTQTINGITAPNGISISPDGSKIYVTSGGSSLYVIDATTYALTTYNSISTSTSSNTSPFISPNLITGTLDISSAADMTTKGFTNYVNFAGGTLRATGSFTLSSPIYLHDAFNLTYDDSSTFTTVAGGTVDTNGNAVTLTQRNKHLQRRHDYHRRTS
ncbi:MAG: YncE family protein [Campylobacterales bacterium]|nr:YncE family protein [Campylobacterales bacterium]